MGMFSIRVSIHVLEVLSGSRLQPMPTLSYFLDQKFLLFFLTKGELKLIFNMNVFKRGASGMFSYLISDRMVVIMPVDFIAFLTDAFEGYI